MATPQVKALVTLFKVILCFIDSSSLVLFFTISFFRLKSNFVFIYFRLESTIPLPRETRKYISKEIIREAPMYDFKLSFLPSWSKRYFLFLRSQKQKLLIFCYFLIWVSKLFIFKLYFLTVFLYSDCVSLMQKHKTNVDLGRLKLSFKAST